MPVDRYDELMMRRASIERESHERVRRHMDAVRAALPLGDREFGGGSSGIRLAPDGSLSADVELQDAHGVRRTVRLRSAPGGPVEEVAVAPTEADTRPEPRARDESGERLAIVAELARRHLPAAATGEFLSLLRPALRLEAAGDGDPVVAQLGGLPTLPINSWPVWEGHGPLSHVLSFDCEPVAHLLPELGLPATGRLAFFYFDGSYDDFESTVYSGDPSSRPGFRVLHLHPEESTRAAVSDAATPSPPGLRPFAPLALTGVRTMTWPSRESQLAEAIWHRAGLVGPRNGAPTVPVEALYEALWDLPGGYDAHQIGGHACPQQGPVEIEVEQLRRGLTGEPFAWGDPEVQSAALDWQLLLQVATADDVDAGMMWGDAGQLYYLVRDIERPEDALFTWQCG